MGKYAFGRPFSLIFMVFKLPMRLIHPIHHPLAVWQVELFIFSKTSQLTLWAAVKDLRLRKLSERLISYKLYEKIFLVSRFLVLVNQDLELVEIQFQPTLYLILLAPFLRVQLINRLHRHHPKIQ